MNGKFLLTLKIYEMCQIKKNMFFGAMFFLIMRLFFISPNSFSSPVAARYNVTKNYSIVFGQVSKLTM